MITWLATIVLAVWASNAQAACEQTQDGDTITFHGCNVVIEGGNLHVRSGQHMHDDGSHNHAADGTGNVIIGWDIGGIDNGHNSNNLILGNGIRRLNATYSLMVGEDLDVGGEGNVVLGGAGHWVRGEYNTVTGGADNRIYSTAEYSHIGGGWLNWVENGQYNKLCGGYQNHADNAFGSWIGGCNHCKASGSLAAIVGGIGHETLEDSAWCTVVGGIAADCPGRFQVRIPICDETGFCLDFPAEYP